MGARFDVNGQIIRAGFGKFLNEAVRIRNHQMDIERKAGHLAQGFDDGRANREIGHEVSVHDIDVEKVGPGRLHAGDFFGQPGKIRRQDRRRYANVRAPHYTAFLSRDAKNLSMESGESMVEKSPSAFTRL